MFSRRGQTIVEYTILIGVVAVVLSYMGTGIKRGVQSLVKVTADQVGNQKNSDQDFSDVQQGYMVGSNAQMQESKSKNVIETGYIPKSGDPVYIKNMIVNDYSDTQTNTITNGGFSPTS